MRRASILIGASLSAALLTACGGSKALPVSPASGEAPSLLGTGSEVWAAARDGVAPSNVIKRFEFTGRPQSYTVPAGVTALRIVVYGARGGGHSLGAPGGRTYATIKVHAGEVLGMFVGGHGKEGGEKHCVTASLHFACHRDGGLGGYNGGASGGYTHSYTAGTALYPGYGGGGASDVRRGGVDGTLAQRVIVAGGGGGQSGGAWYGGWGGNLIGERGDSAYDREGAGHGGAQDQGGARGKIDGRQGGPGLAGEGGGGELSDLRHELELFRVRGGGGGGGGWYGGGGGTGNNDCQLPSSKCPHRGKAIDAGGGGGSSYAEPGACNVDMHRNPFPGKDIHDGFIDILANPECVPH